MAKISLIGHLRCKNSVSRAAMAATLLGGGVAAWSLMAGSVSAQPAVDEIVVTGSHIRTNDRSSTPLTVISSADIAATPAVSLDQMLTRLPDLDNNGGGVSNNQNPNGSNSSATISLRNLGYQRTLVLMDGVRLVPTAWGGQASSVDISTIPTALVDRIDVLKDGASSIYGADAIGGVINIITRRDQKGLRFDGSVGQAGRGDKFGYSGQLALGIPMERGNVTISAGYFHEDPIKQKDRRWAGDQFIGTDAQGLGPLSSRAPGFVTSLPGVGQVYFYGAANQYAVVRPEGGQPTDVLKARGISPPEGVFFLPGTGYRFNINAKNYLVSEADLKHMGLNGRYEITPDVTFVLNGLFSHKIGTMRLNADPQSIAITSATYPGFYIPANLETYSVNPVTGAFTRSVIGGANPGNPFGVTLSGNHRIGTGPRYYTNTFTTFRTNAAFEGKLGKLDWQLGGVYGQSDGNMTIGNSINYRHLAQMTGQLPCGQDVAAGCGVANFLGVGTLTPAQLDYLTFDNTTTNTYVQQFAYGNVSAELLELPAGQLQGALGFEVRRESLRVDPSPADVNFETRTPQAATRGSYDVRSLYGELAIPVLGEGPWGRSLKLNTSLRYDNYSNFGGATTWKVGGDYEINDRVRLRAEASTAFRAPSVADLFGGVAQGQPNGVDPCSTDVGQFKGAGGCVAALTAAGANPATFVSSLSGVLFTSAGGNPNLQPETAKYYGGGVILRPIDGLTATLDYYRIELDDVITLLSGQQILNNCYGPRGIQCEFVTRGPTGDIATVRTPSFNAASERTSGIEGTLRVSLDDWGVQLPHLSRLSARLSANYLIEDTLSGLDIGTIKKKGTFSFGIGEGLPEWKASLNLTGTVLDRFDVSWTARYLGSLTNRDDASKAPGNQAGSIVYNDLSVAFPVGASRFVVGVNNLFDRDPPFLADGSTNSLPAVGYDYVGRAFFAKLSVSFN